MTTTRNLVHDKQDRTVRLSYTCVYAETRNSTEEGQCSESNGSHVALSQQPLNSLICSRRDRDAETLIAIVCTAAEGEIIIFGAIVKSGIFIS